MDLRKSSSRGKMNGSGGVWRRISGAWMICERVVHYRSMTPSLFDAEHGNNTETCGRSLQETKAIRSMSLGEI
jgi:hypothetical protein